MKTRSKRDSTGELIKVEVSVTAAPAPAVSAIQTVPLSPHSPPTRRKRSAEVAEHCASPLSGKSHALMEVEASVEYVPTAWTLPAAPPVSEMIPVPELPPVPSPEAAQPLAIAVVDAGPPDQCYEACGDFLGNVGGKLVPAGDSSRRCWEAWEDECIASLVQQHGSKALS